MKIGIRATGIRHDPEVDLLETLRQDAERYGALGFDGVELCINGRSGDRGPFDRLRAADVVAIGDLATANNLAIPTLSADWMAGFGSAHPELAEWDSIEEAVSKDLSLAQQLGATVILIHFGSATGRWGEAQGILERLAKLAEPTGVKLAFEASIFRRTRLGGLLEMRRMVDDVGSPAFGVYEHPQYPRAGVKAHEEIHLFGRRLYGLHLGRLEEAQIEWEPFLGALDRYFDGCAILGVPADLAEASKAMLDKAIAEHKKGAA